MNKATKLIAAALALVVLGSAAFLLLAPGKTDSPVAVIEQNGAELERITLDEVEKAYSFPIIYPDGGENVVLVEPGRIRVESADCPDKVCVNQGFISDGTVPIACLPHKLIIRIEGGDSGLDAAN